MDIYCYKYKINDMSSTIMVEGRKTISIDTETWERLKQFGKFGESFDDLLNRLMDTIEKVERRK
jgi:predicted CopG family antitoxin